MTWLRSLGTWSYLVVFLAAASEAALLVGLVFPGETVLLVAGFLAWRGTLALPVTVAVAAVGAVVGDSVGYELGRRYGDRVERSAVGRRLGRDRWRRADHYLDEHGGRAVFTSRFVAIAKTLTPALAGRAGMEYRRFLSWNVLGACVWATFHVGLGYVAGPSYETVDRYLSVAGWGALIVLAIVGGGWWWWRRHR